MPRSESKCLKGTKKVQKWECPRHGGVRRGGEMRLEKEAGPDDGGICGVRPGV